MSKKLLLADDSVVIQKLVGLSFANEDVEIISTDNGDDAVIRAREVVPDVILADVVMPGKSGYEVCEAVKSEPSLAHIPVLLLTGTFEAFDEARAEASGANGHITKPFEAQALVSRVTEFMNAPLEVAPIEQEPAPPADLSDPSDSGSDLFAADVTSLADSDADADLIDSLDPLQGTSGVPYSEEDFLLSDPAESRSALFGQPGDVMAADFSESSLEEGDDEEWARSRSDDAAAASAIHTPDHTRDVAPAIEGLSGHADSMEPPPLPPRLAESEPIAATVIDDAESDADDPLADLDAEFAGAAPRADSSPASASDLDTVLAGGADIGEPTIRVAENDSNAKTSRGELDVADVPEGGRQALARVALETRVVRADPASPIEVNPVPREGRSLPPSHSPSPPAMQPSQPSQRAEPVEGGPDPATATVVADLDARLAEAESSSKVTPSSTTDDFIDLDLGPTSMAGDDLDFAFDVSEQQSISDYEDLLDQSYSSLVDISDSQIVGDPSEQSEALAADYDVSTSDLATAPPASPVLPPSPEDPALRLAESAHEEDTADLETEDDRDELLISVPTETPISDAPDSDPYIAPGGSAIELSESPAHDEELIVGESLVAPELRTPSRADLSPIMEQQIQETLEKVAWEAFSDLSETIVKQVMSRVESIAWEVIPQMAETLVREEIRRMKGEDD